MEYVPIGSVLTSSVNVGWGVYAAFLRQQSLMLPIVHIIRVDKLSDGNFLFT